jgi:hypothetical protein
MGKAPALAVLRKECEALGLSSAGNRAALEQRLACSELATQVPEKQSAKAKPQNDENESPALDAALLSALAKEAEVPVAKESRNRAPAAAVGKIRAALGISEGPRGPFADVMNFVKQGGEEPVKGPMITVRNGAFVVAEPEQEQAAPSHQGDSEQCNKSEADASPEKCTSAPLITIRNGAFCLPEPEQTAEPARAPEQVAEPACAPEQSASASVPEQAAPASAPVLPDANPEPEAAPVPEKKCKYCLERIPVSQLEEHREICGARLAAKAAESEAALELKRRDTEQSFAEEPEAVKKCKYCQGHVPVSQLAEHRETCAARLAAKATEEAEAPLVAASAEAESGPVPNELVRWDTGKSFAEPAAEVMKKCKHCAERIPVSQIKEHRERCGARAAAKSEPPALQRWGTDMTFFDDAAAETIDEAALAGLANCPVAALESQISTLAIATPKKGKAKKGDTIADLRAECEKLEVATTGARAVLVARLGWAKLEQAEFKIACTNAGLAEMERPAAVEKLVVLQKKGLVAPPGEDTKALTAPACPSYKRGAFAMAKDVHDSRRTYYVGLAKTERSSCVHCNKAIREGDWRIGKNSSSGFVSFFHTECFARAFGRAQEYDREYDIVNLLRELETSKGRWDIFEAKVMTAAIRNNPQRAARLLKAGLKRRKPGRKAKKALWDSDDEGQDGPLC